MDEQGTAFGQDRSGPVAECFTSARELLRGILDRAGSALSDQELLANLRAAHALIATAEAVKLTLVAELDTRPTAIPGARPGQEAVTFLREGLRMSGPAAKRDVAAAVAVASDHAQLPLMGQALADGEISRDHLDTGVSTLARIPQRLKTKLLTPDPEPAADPSVTDPDPQAGSDPPTEDEGADPGRVRTGAQVIDEVLTRQSRRTAPSTIQVLGRQIVHLLDPDRAERFDPNAVLRRSCTIGTDFAGMGIYRLITDPATHAQLQAIMARWSGPTPTGTATTEDGHPVTIKDPRTPSQRRCDAMVALIMNGDTLVGRRSGCR